MCILPAARAQHLGNKPTPCGAGYSSIKVCSHNKSFFHAPRIVGSPRVRSFATTTTCINLLVMATASEPPPDDEQDGNKVRGSELQRCNRGSASEVA